MDERIERTLGTYEEVADEYQSRHGDRSDVEPIVEAFRDRVADATSTADHAPRVLDVGCGPGWETASFTSAGFEVIGLDITPSFLGDARDRAPDAAFVRGDMRELPVADASVDGLFALASLLHVPKGDVENALRAFRRVLVDEGVLTVVTKRTSADDRESPYGEADRRYFAYYEPSALRERLATAGFAIESLDVEGRWLLVHATTA